MASERRKEIRRRIRKKKRVAKLKKKLAEAKTIKERNRIIVLIKRREIFFTPPKK